MHRRPSISAGRVARRLWTIGLGVWCVIVGASLHMQKAHAGEGEKAKADKETVGRSTTLFPIVKDGLLGFIDRNGTVVVQPQYDRAATESVLDWRIHGRLVPFAPDRRPFGLNEFFWGFHEGMGVIYRDGKCGYIRADGTIAFTPQFDSCSMFQNGVAWVRLGRELALVGVEGDVLLDGVQRASAFSEGLAAVRLEGAWGFVNDTGHLKIPPKYDCVGSEYLPQGYPTGPVFEDGVAWVWQKHKAGLINRLGEYIVEPRFDAVSSFQNGFAWVRSSNKEGLLARSGRFVIPPMVGMVGRWLQEGKVRVAVDGKYGYFDSCGRVVIPHQWSAAGPFQEGFAVVRIGATVSFIDQAGDRLPLPKALAEARPFVGGLAQVCTTDGKWGIVDGRGEFVVQPIYEKMRPFSEGIAVVRSGGVWGAVGADGAVLVEPQFEELCDFKDGHALATIDGKHCLVDARGDYLIPPIYDWIDSCVREGRRLVYSETAYGYVSPDGNVAIRPQFQFAERFHNGIARVGIDLMGLSDWQLEGGRWGYIDREGTWIWQPTE